MSTTCNRNKEVITFFHTEYYFFIVSLFSHPSFLVEFLRTCLNVSQHALSVCVYIHKQRKIEWSENECELQKEEEREQMKWIKVANFLFIHLHLFAKLLPLMLLLLLMMIWIAWHECHYILLTNASLNSAFMFLNVRINSLFCTAWTHNFFVLCWNPLNKWANNPFSKKKTSNAFFPANISKFDLNSFDSSHAIANNE